jgi:hypothetical protein
MVSSSYEAESLDPQWRSRAAAFCSAGIPIADCQPKTAMLRRSVIFVDRGGSNVKSARQQQQTSISPLGDDVRNE